MISPGSLLFPFHAKVLRKLLEDEKKFISPAEHWLRIMFNNTWYSKLRFRCRPFLIYSKVPGRYVCEQKRVPLALKNIAVDVHTSERVRIGQANFGIEHWQWSTFVEGTLRIQKHYMTNESHQSRMNWFSVSPGVHMAIKYSKDWRQSSGRTSTRNFAEKRKKWGLRLFFREALLVMNDMTCWKRRKLLVCPRLNAKQ